MIAHNARSVIQARLHISAGQFRVSLQNVLDRITSGDEFQDRLHPNAPRTTGRPLQTSGLIEMRSDMPLHYLYRQRIQEETRRSWFCVIMDGYDVVRVASLNAHFA